MALTLTHRFATAADVRFAAKMANAAIRGNGDPSRILPDSWTEETALSYVTSNRFRLPVVIANWPERSISNALVAAALVYLGLKPLLRVSILAIDNDVIADLPGNQAQRRRVVDRLLVHGLVFAQANGFTEADTPRIYGAGKMRQYLDSISTAQVTDNGDGTLDFFGVIADVVAELDARSPS